MQLTCPTCGATVDLPTGPGRPRHLPFCSRRCQLIDLGEWVEERRVVPGQRLALGPEDPLEGPEGRWP